jgi:probable HAF family extracellular repeat protein
MLEKPFSIQRFCWPDRRRSRFRRLAGPTTQIDVAGAIYTSASGINSAGDIVGLYYAPPDLSCGFLLHAGVFTKIQGPDGGQTFAYGINDNGQIVGELTASAFVYDIQTKAFTEFQYPGAGHTTAFAINNSGTIVGAWYSSKYEGFQFDGQTFTNIEVDGATETLPTAINNSGQSLVLALNLSGLTSFLFDRGKLTKLGGYLNAEPYGMNDKYVFTGNYTMPNTSNVVGFVYHDGVQRVLKFPGAKSTYPTAINDSGEVVGWFYDMSGNIHGFSWLPPADLR